MQKHTGFIQVEVISYDEHDDTFRITVPVIEDPSSEHRDGMQNSGFDADDFDMSASAFAFLVGEFDQPDQFVGKSFDLICRSPK